MLAPESDEVVLAVSVGAADGSAVEAGVVPSEGDEGVAVGVGVL